MPVPITSADIPEWPLPQGFDWHWSRHSGAIHVVHGAPSTWRSVAEIGTTSYDAYQVLTGRHRRVHMRRCFRPLALALRYAHRWTWLRAAAIVAELEGRAPDPTRTLDANLHDWRDVRALLADPADRPARPRVEPAKGICRIERPSKGGLGR
jgi:hypothetical protein